MRTALLLGLIIAVAMALPVVTMVSAQQLAADLPVSTPVVAPSLHGYGDQNMTCVAWTDECRTCARDVQKVSCSNIGIACQPAAIRCTARQQPAK